MNTVTANIRVIEKADNSIVFQNEYQFTKLMKKDGTMHLTNHNKMERSLKKTRDMLNSLYMHGNHDRKLVCKFNIVNK